MSERTLAKPTSDASAEVRERQAALMQDAAEFHRVLTELVRVYMFRDRDRSASHDVGVTGAHALDILVHEGLIGLNQLATELFVDKSTASRIVASLEAKGYVARTTDPEDRRAVQLQLTAAGRELHERIQADNLREAAELLRSFAIDVRQGMTARLRQIAGTYAVRGGVTEASVSLVSSELPHGAYLRIAGTADLEEAFELLSSLGLPTQGIDEHFVGSFVVAREPENDAVIGLAGVESYGSLGLLHSVAIHPEYQGAGLGRALTTAVVNLARTRGVRELFLLTTILEDKLLEQGWEKIGREELPPSLLHSEQVRRVLTSDPAVMRLRLT